MTLREKIELLIERVAVGGPSGDVMNANETADAILAAIREHMTSPEAVERACAVWYGNSLMSEGDKIDARAAILAALGEE